jgi:thiol-disulfide isomerase/thioredoxin
LEPALLLSPSFKAVSLGLAAACAALLGGCDRETSAGAQPAAAATPASALDRSHKGSGLPEFVFANPAGKEMRLSSYKGKPLLINLWATWCAPCVAELPLLDAVAAREGARLKVLTISQDGPRKDKVPAFLAQRGVKLLEPWIDPELELMTHYRADTLPMTILYDAQGREVWRVIGPREWNDAASAKVIGEAFSD